MEEIRKFLSAPIFQQDPTLPGQWSPVASGVQDGPVKLQPVVGGSFQSLPVDIPQDNSGHFHQRWKEAMEGRWRLRWLLHTGLGPCFFPL
jgi:hypothetical protein